MSFSTFFSYTAFFFKKYVFFNVSFKLSYSNIVNLFLFLDTFMQKQPQFNSSKLYKFYLLYLTVKNVNLRTEIETLYVLFHLIFFDFNTNVKKISKKTNRKVFSKFWKKFMRLVPFFQISRWKSKPFFKNNKFHKIVGIFWKTRSRLFEFTFEKFNFKKRNNFSVLFLRKTKSFYKGRYARNRQTCRVIVFWTLAFNLIWLYGLYFFFYQFTFNFGYIWWGIYFFLLSLLAPTIIKYKYYNPINMAKEFILFFEWLFLILKSYFKK